MSKNSRERAMDRREFLRTTAVGSAAGATVVGASGCAGLFERGHNGELTINQTALLEHLEQIDSALESLSSTQPLSRFVERHLDSPVDMAHPAVVNWLHHGDALARKSLRSLFFAGALWDLPEGARELPMVRSRIDAMSREMDEAILETTALISSIPKGEGESLRRALRQDPERVMRIAELIDEEGSDRGLRRRGRRKLRELCTYVSGRLHRQSPSILFDECIEKVERIATFHDLDITERSLIDETVALTFWGEEDDEDPRAMTSKKPEAAEGESEADAETHGDDATPRRRGDGRGMVIGGGTVSGLGTAMLIGGGVALSAGSIAGAFVMTPGGILLLVGLIVLAVGGTRRDRALMRRGQEKRERRER